jgi:glycosyltransferase involved in cell wall biosynthesis
MIDISVVIPAYNEEDSLSELLEQVSAVIHSLNKKYELIVVDDGSSDGTMEKLKSLKHKYPSLRVISFRKNYGKSAALAVAFKVTQGSYVITMDADLQDDPNEIPNLISKLGDFDLVSGWKRKRFDPISKKVPSKFFNFVTSRLTGIPIHDFNCGLKAYKQEVVNDLMVYGELHRFLPVLAHWKGFKVGETVVKHHPRKYGTTKFGFSRFFNGFSRFFNGFFDLITVLFITRYQTTPLHLFGMFGVFASFLGFAIELYLTILWFMGEGIRNRPLFFLGILSIIVGIQFMVFGLLGEMISARFAEKVNYSIKEQID